MLTSLLAQRPSRRLVILRMRRFFFSVYFCHVHRSIVRRRKLCRTEESRGLVFPYMIILACYIVPIRRSRIIIGCVAGLITNAAAPTDLIGSVAIKFAAVEKRVLEYVFCPSQW